MSEEPASLLADVGIVFDDVRLMDRGLKASGDSMLTPAIRGEPERAAGWISRGCGGADLGPLSRLEDELVMELALVDFLWPFWSAESSRAVRLVMLLGRSV